MAERQAFIDFISRISKEGSLIVLIVACSFLLLALSTFDALDPGWSHLGYSGLVRNRAGMTGAWLADFSFSMLGYMAFLLPVMLIYRAWVFLRRKQQRWQSALPFMFLRTSGAVLMVGAGAALAAIHVDNQWLTLPFEAGGIVGLSLASQALQVLGLIGSTLVLLGGLVLGVTLYTDLSWLTLAQWLGATVLDGVSTLSQLFDRSDDSIQQGINRTSSEGRLKSSVAIQESGEGKQQNNGMKKALSGLFQTSASLKDHPSNSATPLVTASSNIDVAARGRVELATGALNTVNELDGTGLSAAAAELSEHDVLNELSSLDTRQLQSVGAVSPAEHETGVNAEHKELKIIPLSETISALDESADEPRRVSSRAAKPLSDHRQIPDVEILDQPEEKKSQGYSAEQLESM